MSEESKNTKVIQEQNTPTNFKPETRKVLVEDTDEFDETDDYEEEYDDEEYEEEYDEQEETDQIKELAAKGSKKNHNKFAVVKDRFGNIYVEDRRKKIRHKNILYISVGVGVLSLVASAYLGAMLLTKKDSPSDQKPIIIPDLKTEEELNKYFDSKVNIIPASANTSPELMKTKEQLDEQVAVTLHKRAKLDDSAIESLGLATAVFNDKPKNVTFEYKLGEKAWTGAGNPQKYDLFVWAIIPTPVETTPETRTTNTGVIESSPKIYSISSSDLNQDVVVTTQAKLDEYVASILLLQVENANVSSKVWDTPRETNILDAAAQIYYGIEVSSVYNKPVDVHLEYVIVKDTDFTVGSKLNYTITVVGKTAAGLTSRNNVQETFATSDNYHTTQTELNDYVERVKEAFTTPSLTYQELDGLAATDELFNQAAITKLKLVGTLPAKPSDVVLTYSFFKRNPPATNGQHQSYILQIYGNVITTGDADPREVSTENITYVSSNVIHNNSGIVATEFGKFFTAINGSSLIVSTIQEDTINVLPSVGIVQSTDLFSQTYTPSAGITTKFEVKTRTASSVTVDITLSAGTGVDLATDTKTLVIVYSKLQASVANDAIIAAKSELASLNNTKSTLSNVNFTSTTADKTNYSTRLGISSISALTNLTAANFTITTPSTPKFARTISVVLENTDSTLSLSDRTITFVLYVADKNELDVADEKSYFESLTSTSNVYTDGTITTLPSLGPQTDFSLILGIDYRISNPFVDVSYEVLTASGSSATVRIIFTSKDTSPTATIEKNLTITYSGIYDPVAAANAKLEAAYSYLTEQLDATVSTNILASFTVGEIMTLDDYADGLGIEPPKYIDELTSATFTVRTKNTGESSVTIDFTISMNLANPGSMTGYFKLITGDKFESDVNTEISAFEAKTGIIGQTFNENTIALLPTVGLKDDYSTLFTPSTPYASGDLVNVEYYVENIDVQNSTAEINIIFTHVEASNISVTKTILITYTKLSQASDANRNVNAVRTALNTGSPIISTNVWNSFKDLSSVTKTNVASLGLGDEANSAINALTGVTMTLVNDPTPGATYKKNVTVTMTMDGFTGDASLLTFSFSLVASDKNNLDLGDEIINFETNVTSGNTFDEATITTLPTTSTTSLNSIITTTYTPGTKVDITYVVTRVGSVDATLVVTFTNKANSHITNSKTINVTYTTVRTNYANDDVTSARTLLIDKTSTLSSTQIITTDVTLDNYWTKLGIDKIDELSTLTYIEDIQFNVVDNGDYTFRVNYTIVSQFAYVSKTGFFTLTASDVASHEVAQAKVDAVRDALLKESPLISTNYWDSFKDLTTVDKTGLTALGLGDVANIALADITSVTANIESTAGATFCKDITIIMTMNEYIGDVELLTLSFVLVAKDKNDRDDIADEIASFRSKTGINGSTFNETTISTLPTTSTTSMNEIITTTYTSGPKVSVTYRVSQANGISAEVNVIFTSVANIEISDEITITVTYTKIRSILANADVNAAIALLVNQTSTFINSEITPGTYGLDNYTTMLGISEISGLSALEYVEWIEFVVTSNNDYTFEVVCTITSDYATTPVKTAYFTLAASDKEEHDLALAQIAVDAEKALFETAIDFENLIANTFEEQTITTVPDDTETDLANIITIEYTPTDGIDVTYVVTTIDETSVSVTVTFTSATFSQVTSTLTFIVSYTPAP